jgi:hypothetical protein
MRTSDSVTGGITRLTLDAARGEDRPEPDGLDGAVDALLEDGVVVIRGAIDPAPLDRLRTRMSADLDLLMRRPDRAENFAAGHLQQDPPAEDGLLVPEMLMNPHAVEICRRALMQPIRLNGYTNNTNLPGSELQAVHVDEGQLWPGLTTPHPPARLTVNIPLSSTDESQGAIEVWPGSHRDVRMCQFSATAAEATARALEYVRAAKNAQVRQRVNRRVGLTVPAAMLTERRGERPPERATTQLGDLIIRDPRVWHRGTPNLGDRARFMVALTYDPTWRRASGPIELPSAVRPMIEATGVDVFATYVDGPIEHLERHRPPTDSPLRRLPRDR